MAFFDDATLANMLMIDPMRKRFCQRDLDLKLLACCILTQDQGEGPPSKGIAFPRLVILQREPFASPGTEPGPADDIGSTSVLAVLVVSELAHLFSYRT